MARRRGRVDANHADIVGTLRAAGALVQSLADLGHGCPDVLVGYAGDWYVAEIKTAKGELTPDETLWWESAEYRGLPVRVWRTADQALEEIGATSWS